MVCTREEDMASRFNTKFEGLVVQWSALFYFLILLLVRFEGLVEDLVTLASRIKRLKVWWLFQIWFNF